MRTEDILGEEALVLPRRFLYICDNNMLAAFLLQHFDGDNFVESKIAEMNCREKEFWLYTNDILAERMYNLYSPSDIFNAIQFLQQKKYISTWWFNENREDETQSQYYYVAFHERELEKSSQLYERKRQQERETEQTDPLQLSPPSSQEELARRAHAMKIAEERKRVEQHCKRARKAGLTATLTLDQWLGTLEYFHWQCAYCQNKRFELLEHFVPLTHGEGTTQTNCVPACRSCNGLKQSWNPLKPWGPDMSHIKDGIDRVKNYLAKSGIQREQVVPNSDGRASNE